MPRRPLPIHVRGPRRRRQALNVQLFACPKLSPEWEFKALAALIKPQFKEAIMHRKASQEWTDQCDRELEEVVRLIGQRLDFRPIVHRSDDGDYHFAAHYTAEQQSEAIAFARLLSKRLPELWFVVGRYFVKDGAFYRRGRGYRFPLVPAAEVHLRRDIRAALAGALK